MSQQYARLDSTSHRQLRPIHRSKQSAGPGTFLVMPGLQQLTAIRHHWPANATGAVCTERSFTSGDWCLLKWSHHAVLRQLHWLPVRQSVNFKVIGLVFQSLTGQVPVYFANESGLVSDANILMCEVPWSRNRFGNRSSLVASPHLWNAVPSTLRQTDASFDCLSNF